jgi:hypothetical protein
MISLARRTVLAIERRGAQQLRRAGDRRQRIAQLVRQHGQELVLLAVRRAQLVLGQLALGDVAALDEDADHRARGVAHRLVDEIDEALGERAVRLALQLDRHGGADERLADW